MMIQFEKSAVISCALLLVTFLCFTSTVSAAEREQVNTVVTVGERCGGCVKKIAKRFDSEKAVAKVVCNIEKKTVTIVPAKGVRLSPKGVWEVMDSIEKRQRSWSVPMALSRPNP